MSVIPAFAWKPPCQPAADATAVAAAGTRSPVREVSIHRRTLLRVRLRRPWFSSGEDERIGIVLWPPNLFELKAQDVQQDILRAIEPGGDPINLGDLPDDKSGILTLQDADLGPGGIWVSRWGSDPIRPGSGTPGWLLSIGNFPEARRAAPGEWTAAPSRARRPQDASIVPHALMPVPAGADAQPTQDATPAGGFMAVSLLTYEPRFDPEQEVWYADVEVDPLQLDSPFVRLGIVRYQPHAKRRLQLSEPVIEWAQVLPPRTVCAQAEVAGREVRITVTTKGPAGERGARAGRPETSSAQRACVRITLLKRPVGKDEHGARALATIEAASALDASGIAWTGRLTLDRDTFLKEPAAWSVYVEEVDRMRPANYPDEPRYATREDELFAESGPRFAAMLELEALKIWVASQLKT